VAEVTVYTKTGCPYCAAALQNLKDNGKDFEERNIYLNKAWIDELLSYSDGKRLVPVIVEGEDIQLGFNGH
jgi:glutaredoxin